MKYSPLDALRDAWSFLPLPGGRPGEPSEHDIYLSPHCDDVCFSLGGHVMGRRRGTMLVVFCRSKCINNWTTMGAIGYEAGSMPTPAQVEQITAIRHEEDRRFAAHAGLALSYIGLDEAPLRGRGPFDSGYAVEDTDRWSERILGSVRKLIKIRPSTPKPALYCPMAIGGHLDHRIVRDTVLENLLELELTHEVFLYEDLPYAADAGGRKHALHQLHQLCGMHRRRALPVRDPAHKAELIAIYASQHMWPPPRIRDFTPAVGPLSWLVHEAVWSL